MADTGKWARKAAAACLRVAALAMVGLVIGGGLGWLSWDPVARNAAGKEVGVSTLGSVLNMLAWAGWGALAGAVAGVAFVAISAWAARRGATPAGPN